MSNFQRTRSKVWWNDSPPNVGSPVAKVECNPNRNDWEPQLPHWIANPPEQKDKSTDDIAQPIQINQWPLRHGSPGSHKSQDSGFSDSDSSPPPSQYYQPPESNESNKSASSSDSNNNENITVKQASNFQTSPQSQNVCDSCAPDSFPVDMPIPKPRLRSSSVIETPYDLQKYCEVHQDEEHLELLKDKDVEDVNLNKTEPKYPAPKNLNKAKSNKENAKNALNNKVNGKVSIKVENIKDVKDLPPTKASKKENVIPKNSAIEKNTKDIPVKNINVISPSKKYPVKKTFISSTDSDNTKVIKLATVKDLETSKNKLEESLEYLKLEDNNQIAVNNQPRNRTPISNVSYIRSERTTTQKAEFIKRSISNEYNLPISVTPKFQRNRLNKSLNFEAQKLDQQILDIQEGYHSLGYIDEDEITTEAMPYEQEQIHTPAKAILGKNIMDSLNLKPNKKAGLKAKQRMANKGEKSKDLFRIFPKKGKPTMVDTHAGGHLNGSRVPSLGLPRSKDRDTWVEVGYPEREMLIPHYNERLVATESELNPKPKDKHEEDYLKRLTPPPQFQDIQKIPYETDSGTNKNLTHDSKREKLKGEMDFVDVQLNLACTSTPKMLTPCEFMDVPNSDRKITRRINLIENFNGG